MSIKYYNSGRASHAADFVVDQLRAKLSDGPVLFLLAGGSAVELAVEISHKFESPVKQLCISLTDERFGPPGHSDSNWAKLEEAGFKFDMFDSYPVLQGRDMSGTVDGFSQFLDGWVSSAKSICGLFGMGADGHTAGILPNSGAIVSAKTVTGYIANDFSRITVTPTFMKHLDTAFLYANGKEKHQQLDRLDEQIELSQQPAQALKYAKSLIVLNDYKGDKL